MSNSTRYAKWPPQSEVAAEAFATFCDANLPAALVSWARRYEETMAPGHVAGHLCRDSNLNWVVAYPFDGPFTFAGSQIAGPSGLASALGVGVVVDTPDWFDFG